MTSTALLVGLTHIDPTYYNGWDGRNGCDGCALDVESLARVLVDRKWRVRTLLNGAATGKAILDELRRLVGEAVSGDRVLFYFSGHGGKTFDDSGDEIDGYDETLVSYDGQLRDDLLNDVWLSVPEGVRIYMLSDSCNSGTNFRVAPGDPPPPLEPEKTTADLRGDKGKELKAKMLHIGGCRDGRTSTGLSGGGVFTQSLVNRMNGGFSGTWRQLYNLVRGDVTDTQDPQLNLYPEMENSLDQESPFESGPFTPGGGPAIPLQPRNPDSTSNGGESPEETAPAPLRPSLVIRAQEEETLSEPEALLAGEIAPKTLLTGNTRTLELPISDDQARKATRWLMENFGEKIRAAAGSPFSPALVCAIACQETAYFWLPLMRQLAERPEFADDPTELADTLIARCVLDASGDYPGAPRSAFPVNTAAFRSAYGATFTDMLIGEANATRALRGYGPKQWVYKGYGIFQYDLQSVREDESFFRDREWYDFSKCLEKCLGELRKKYRIVGGDLWEAVRAYNGSGARARAYRDNVRHYTGIAEDEISKMPGTRDMGARDAAVPASRPRLSKADLAAKLAGYGIDRGKYPLVVAGIRGYYMDTMGQPGVNDRGVYDDALFIDSPDAFASFNGNTDPSKYKPGAGTGSGKGMASLKAGAWYAHKLDFHGSQVYGPYRAICQRLGNVTVLRDGDHGAYEDTGDFGINIHKGSYNGTSSLGCQTIHPDQWPSFISLAQDLAKRYYGARWDKTVIPYILMEA